MKSPQWLRNLKFKKYPFWRIDKPRNLQIIENGGWHFAYLQRPENISKKIKSFAHGEFNKPNFVDMDNIKEKINMKTKMPVKLFILNAERQDLGFLILTILILTFIIGSLILSCLSSMSASMNLLNKTNFSIGGIVVLLFSIPVIIFSINFIRLWFRPRETANKSCNLALEPAFAFAV